MEEITIPKSEYEMMLHTILSLVKRASLLESEIFELKMRVEPLAVKKD